MFDVGSYQVQPSSAVLFDASSYQVQPSSAVLFDIGSYQVQPSSAVLFDASQVLLSCLMSVATKYSQVLMSCVVWAPTLIDTNCSNVLLSRLMWKPTLVVTKYISFAVLCNVGSHSSAYCLHQVLLSCTAASSSQSLPLSESCCVLATNLSLATAQSTATGRPADQKKKNQLLRSHSSLICNE